jgi:hypothetical protein
VRGLAKAASAATVKSSRGARPILVVAFAVAVAFLFIASTGQAATVYRPLGERFATPGSGPGQQEAQPGQVAVDDATGAVLVATNSPKVNVFVPESASTAFSTSFGEGELGGATGLAVDQATRSVYVGDGGFGRIAKYDISGSGPLTFTPDASFVSPVEGSEPGQIAGIFSARLAVDPTTGDLLVADRFNQRVSRYTSDGAFVSSFDGTGSPGGAFKGLSSIAVDATGAIYVVDVTVPDIVYEYGRSVLERFAADGTPDPSFVPAIPTPRTVTVDPSTGNVVVAGRSDGGYTHGDKTGPYPVRLYTLHNDLVIDELDLAAGDAGAIVTGMAIGDGASKRLYALTAPGLGGSIAGLAFESFLVPDVLLDEPTAVTDFTAHLSGSANPLGQASSYHFEYSREGGAPQSTAEVPLEEGSATVPVTAELSGLIPNSDYEVRLVGTAGSTGASVSSAPRHFKTAVAPPQTITGDAIDRTSTTATLLGKINPYGQQTSYRFEYGSTADYGLSQPVDHEDVAGNGRDALPVHAYLANLQPGTEYHYRLVAENPTGVSAGADRTFVTLGAPDRVYEQVTPVNKGGSEVNGLRIFYAAPDGEGLLYQWKAAPGDGVAGGVQPRGFGWRKPTGWSALSLDPPQLAGTPVFGYAALTYVIGISEDATKVVAISLKALAPGATEGDTNLYLRDTRTGEYTTMFSVPGTDVFGRMLALGGSPIVDGTPDYSRVLIRTTYDPLLPAAPEGALYEWSEGQLRFASVASDGTPMGEVPVGGTAGQGVHDPHYISADGSKVFFQSGASTYVRIDGEETVSIGGSFAGASRDGHYAFVFGTELTPDSEPGVASLYRFDTDARQLELLTPTGTLEGILQISANGASAFFNTSIALTSDAEAGSSNLYVWHDGEVRLVATRDVNLDGYGRPAEFVASPNGRYLAFGAYSPLTGYDNRSKTACLEFNIGDPKGPAGEGVACQRIYRYDVDSEELLCASCPRDGSPPTGRSRITTDNVEGDFSFNRSMLDDGTVVFDTTEPLNARDSNSRRDVYTFDGHETTLISGGQNNVSSQLDEASADGRDIFFTTQDQLVGQDTDTLADVYDARIGGGIPGQNPPPPRGECIRDDCKATPNGGPELPFGGSEGLSGPQNVRPEARKRCGKGRHARKVKGKSRCVTQVKKKKTKQATSNRRQGR